MYKKIIDPIKNKIYNLNSKNGYKILKRYLKTFILKNTMKNFFYGGAALESLSGAAASNSQGLPDGWTRSQVRMPGDESPWIRYYVHEKMDLKTLSKPNVGYFLENLQNLIVVYNCLIFIKEDDIGHLTENFKTSTISESSTKSSGIGALNYNNYNDCLDSFMMYFNFLFYLMSNTAKSINIHELNKLLELYITCNVENIETKNIRSKNLIYVDSTYDIIYDVTLRHRSEIDRLRKELSTYKKLELKTSSNSETTKKSKTSSETAFDQRNDHFFDFEIKKLEEDIGKRLARLKSIESGFTNDLSLFSISTENDMLDPETNESYDLMRKHPHNRNENFLYQKFRSFLGIILENWLKKKNYPSELISNIFEFIYYIMKKFFQYALICARTRKTEEYTDPHFTILEKMLGIYREPLILNLNNPDDRIYVKFETLTPRQISIRESRAAADEIDNLVVLDLNDYNMKMDIRIQEIKSIESRESDQNIKDSLNLKLDKLRSLLNQNKKTKDEFAGDIPDLFEDLPKILHQDLRSEKYYQYSPDFIKFIRFLETKNGKKFLDILGFNYYNFDRLEIIFIERSYEDQTTLFNKLLKTLDSFKSNSSPFFYSSFSSLIKPKPRYLSSAASAASVSPFESEHL